MGTKGKSDSCDQCMHGYWLPPDKLHHHCCSKYDLQITNTCECNGRLNGKVNVEAVTVVQATTEDFAVWSLAAVGVGAVLFSAARCTVLRKGDPETMELV